ncbi:MAG: LamG domain-containing protein, partial [Colwellia sp.]|uniref:DUF6701 domain-containing protein n=1 Tax=Colwellia sp. TaxID=56799 RepID=UPI001E04408E
NSTQSNEAVFYYENNSSSWPTLRESPFNASTKTAVSNISTGSWKHHVWTRKTNVNNGELCLYIDNVLQGCSTHNNGEFAIDVDATGFILGQEQDSLGGGFDSSQAFSGLLDEVLLFDRVLSTTEINDIYTNQNAGNNYDGSSRECDVCDSIPGQLNAVGIRIDGNGSNSKINTTTEALTIYAAWLTAGSPTSGLIDSGTYNVAASGTSTVDRVDFGGSSHDFLGTLPYPGVGAGVSGSDFLVHTSGTISLPAGSYTIYVEADDGFSFIMDTLSGDTVLFNKFGSSTSGESNELRFENPTGNSNTGGSFTLTEDSIFDIAAIFFERSGGDYLEISISNDIRSNAAPSGYEILKHGALSYKVKFGACVGLSQINHYQIIHDGNGLTCAAEEVIIKACTNTYDGTCTQSDEAVTLVVKTTGSNVVTDTISFTGEGTANLAYTKSELTILSIESASIIPTSPAVCFDSSTTSCNLFFADTGFRFYENIETNPIPTQVSAKPSNILKIQAIEKNSDTGACQAAFIDTTAIEMAATCIDPIACAGSQVAINNLSTSANIVTLDNNAVLSYSSVGLDFSDDKVNSAEFIFTYPDAGKIQLHARYNIPDDNGDPSGNYMLGSSNKFVVRPFGFFIDVIDNPDPVTTDENGDIFKKAGEDFKVQLKAVVWQSTDDSNDDDVPDIGADLSNNNVTVNFGKENSPATAEVSHALVAPSTGVLGALTISDTFSFTNGIASDNTVSYSEVGIISFAANLKGNSYLGASDVQGNEPYIGRFTPAYFEITEVINGDLTATCSTGGASGLLFAYSGQMSATNVGAIGYEVLLGDIPGIIIAARNKSGSLTKNYIEGFFKLSESSYQRLTPTTDARRTGKDGNFVNLQAHLSPPVITDSAGKITYRYANNDNYVYLKETNSEINEFPSDIDLAMTSIIDGDGISTEDYDGDINNGLIVTLHPREIPIRFGRAQLENSYGPETSSLPQPLSVNYFKDGQYVLSVDDNCTQYNAVNMSLTNIDLINFSLAPPLPNILPALGEFISEVSPGITRAIELTAPGAGNIGQVCVSYAIAPWLQYKWAVDEDNLQCPFVTTDVDGLFNDNPFSVATFGIYRGNDRIIYQREIAK